MSLTLPGGSDRLSRDREEAHARYHEALAALDRIVNDTARAVTAGPLGAADLLQRAVTFQSLLVQFIQQVTPYIDTKLRVIEQAAADATMTATAAQRAAMAAQRRASDPPSPTASARQASDVGPGTPSDPGPLDVGPKTSCDDAVYVGFEDLYRGSESAIRERQRDYVELYSGARDVLDVGCGRGEFLSLLREAGIDARGIDTNEEMVEACRTKGLQAERTDAVSYLRGLKDESLGGLFAAQVVEHLPPAQLLAFIREAARVLRPGARLVLETINPSCWVAFFESYIRDLTHTKPLHPDTLKFLVVAGGFGEVKVRFRTPVPESDRLQRIELGAVEKGELRALIDAFNLNMERLNDRLFTHLDYAIVARRG
jgi:SAM-dependent methyltransferase